MTRLRSAVAAAAVVVLAAPASAHNLPFSYLDLHLQPAAIDGTLAVHIVDAGYELNITPPERLLDPSVAAQQSRALVDVLRPRLHVLVDGHELQGEWGPIEPQQTRDLVRMHIRYTIQSPPASVTVVASLFPYDATHQTFLNVYEGASLTQAIVDRDRTSFEYFTGTRQGSLAVVKKFLPAGIHHILIGPDHILFLVGLLLLGGTIRRLALVATAFTAAHSITLTLAAVNIVSPPPRIIEPAIALSIVYVGVDNLLVREGRDVRAWIAFAFGFIHGFGFASVLREMDLPARALGWSLFSFNLGVEIGQLIVVVAVTSAFAVLRSRSEAAGRQLAVAGSIVVVAAGAFWFVQRAFFPGGL